MLRSTIVGTDDNGRDPPTSDAAPEAASSPYSQLTEETRLMTDLGSLSGTMGGPVGMLDVDPLPKGLRPHLEITRGPQVGKLFAITKPMTMLGRVEDVVDVVVPDEAASRHHAAIAHKEGCFTLYDLGSTNGTSVNDAPIAACEITHGSEIRVGDTVFRFWRDCDEWGHPVDP